MASTTAAGAAPLDVEHGEKTLLRSRSKFVCEKAHVFDNARHLPGEELCAVKHSSAEKDRILLQPGAHRCHNKGRAPRAQVTTSYLRNSERYYLVKFANAGSTSRYYLKHYDDFVMLHQGLQDLPDGRPWGENPISILPQLPVTGRFGVRHRLSSIGIGHFVTRLQQDLEAWLQMILAQVPSLDVHSALEDFFGDEALPHGVPESQRARLDDLLALLILGNDTTAAVKAVAVPSAPLREEDEEAEETTDQEKAPEQQDEETTEAVAVDSAHSQHLQSEDEESEKTADQEEDREQLVEEALEAAAAVDSAPPQHLQGEDAADRCSTRL